MFGEDIVITPITQTATLDILQFSNRTHGGRSPKVRIKGLDKYNNPPEVEAGDSLVLYTSDWYDETITKRVFYGVLDFDDLWENLPDYIQQSLYKDLFCTLAYFGYDAQREIMGIVEAQYITNPLSQLGFLYNGALYHLPYSAELPPNQRE